MLDGKECHTDAYSKSTAPRLDPNRPRPVPPRRKRPRKARTLWTEQESEKVRRATNSAGMIANHDWETIRLAMGLQQTAEEIETKFKILRR